MSFVMIIGMLSSCSSNSSKVINIEDYVTDEIEIPDGSVLIEGIKYYFSDLHWEKEELPNGQKSSSLVSVHGDIYVVLSKCENEEITSLDIPSALIYKGIEYPIISIGSHAFSNCKNLNKISIPNSITDIAQNAFSECEALKSLSIPGSVEDFGIECNDNLEHLELKNGIQQVYIIGGSKLTKVKLPKSVKIVNKISGENIKEISLNKELETIKYRGLEGNSSLKEIKIPENVKEVGSYLFYECNSLTSVEILGDIRELDATFDGCESLKHVKLSNNIEKLEQTFYECTALETIILPSSLKEIGYGTFKRCSNLKKIELPKDLERIGEYAFDECSSLTQIVIPKTVNYIGTYAFTDCDLTSIKILNPVPFPERLAFGKYGYPCPLYVPAQSVYAYENETEAFGYYFADRIKPIE